MRNILSRIALVLALPILLASCANHKSEPLQPLSFNLEAPLESVYTSCKAYDKKESIRYLGKNVLSRGYQPVQISIRNNSKDTYYLPIGGISLPLEDPYKVAGSMHYSTATRTVAFTGAGYVGANLVALPGIVLLGPIGMIPVLATLIATPVIAGVNSSNANHAIDRDIEKKGAKDTFILPHTTANMVLFVSEDQFKEDFSVTLNNTVTGEVFVVEMHCN